MKRSFWILSVLFIFGFTVNSFSVIVTEPRFPYKGFIYTTLGVPAQEYKNVEILEETHMKIRLRYDGREYQGQLFTYGAIFITTEGRNPILISLDIKQLRRSTFVNPLQGRLP
jgi:hypothetical protein